MKMVFSTTGFARSLALAASFSLITPGGAIPAATYPVNYGMVLFRAFELMDVFGPLDVLQFTAYHFPLKLHLLSRTLNPVKTEPASAQMNPQNSSFYPTFNPTHTFDEILNSNIDLDVLIVPGGPGVRNPDLAPEIEFVKKVFPRVKYLITICTGASVAAQAGVLDGKRATTNKAAWGEVTPLGPNVKWVAPARWVVDGNVWTSSGVTAGIDLIFEFVKTAYPDGEALTHHFGGVMEYQPQTNSSFDPFSEMFEVPTQNQI